MKILAVGSIALDSVKTPFGSIKDALGGSAVYFGVAASYFADVSIVGVVGKDFPQKHLDALRSRGVDTSGIVIEEGETFRWSGEYGYGLGERDTLETHLGVFEKFNPLIPSELSRSEFIFLANIDPELQFKILRQATNRNFAACDTMDFWIEGKRKELDETMRRVDMMIVNDSECRQLAEEPNLIKAARKVLRMGPHAIVVKKGEHGALLMNEKSMFSAPAFPCEDVFDPTGAGDTFAGGMIGYLAKAGEISERQLRQAVLYGTVMASYCVEKFSIEGICNLTSEEIESRFRQLKELTSI
ncbi:MAG: PfkB family carbohydrate kinase [Actinomycetota bacterium]|nr:PfkB family carbohydrate kinase [Actinomycetota bacterium]